MLEKEARKAIKEAGGSWKVFCKWMSGQTMGMIDGEIHYYDCDVDRFIRYKCNPDNEPLVDFD